MDLVTRKLSYVDIDNLFLRLFPDGFEDKAWLALGKKHGKPFEKLIQVFDNALAPQSIEDALMLGGNLNRAIDGAKSVINLATTVSVYEKIAFRNYISTKSIQREFMEILNLFLYDDYQKYFPKFVHVLGKTKDIVNNSNCTKWTIVSIFLNGCYPNEHTFLKPTSAKLIAKMLGLDIDYQSYPNVDTYNKFNDIVLTYKNKSHLLKGHNNITGQAVLYCIAYNFNGK